MADITNPAGLEASTDHRYLQDLFVDAPKRKRTKALILDTAIVLLAEKGVEKTSVAEITEQAGLSNGSFYYHFRDKNHLLTAVGGLLSSVFVDEIDLAMSGVESGIERVAIATQLFVQRATQTPNWGGAVVNALADLGAFRDQIAHGIQEDVKIGVDQRLFSVPDVPAIFPMLLAFVGAAVRETLRDPVANADCGMVASELILRALGIGIDAAAIAAREARAMLGQFDMERVGEHLKVLRRASI